MTKIVCVINDQGKFSGSKSFKRVSKIVYLLGALPLIPRKGPPYTLRSALKFVYVTNTAIKKKNDHIHILIMCLMCLYSICMVHDMDLSSM